MVQRTHSNLVNMCNPPNQQRSCTGIVNGDSPSCHQVANLVLNCVVPVGFAFRGMYRQLLPHSFLCTAVLVLPALRLAVGSLHTSMCHMTASTVISTAISCKLECCAPEGILQEWQDAPRARGYNVPSGPSKAKLSNTDAVRVLVEANDMMAY